MLEWLLKWFRPRTVKSIVDDIFEKIDELEIISEQQELIYDQIDAQIEELVEKQRAATTEGLYAEAVASKLRQLVEPVSE